MFACQESEFVRVKKDIVHPPSTVFQALMRFPRARILTPLRLLATLSLRRRRRGRADDPPFWGLALVLSSTGSLERVELAIASEEATAAAVGGTVRSSL
jgi:hypothetical protein